MHRFRSLVIIGSYEVLVDFLSNKRHHRSCRLGDGNETGPESHICIYFVLLHALSPEAFSGPADIPVGQLVNEGIESIGSLGNPVTSQILVTASDSRHKP